MDVKEGLLKGGEVLTLATLSNFKGSGESSLIASRDQVVWPASTLKPYLLQKLITLFSGLMFVY